MGGEWEFGVAEGGWGGLRGWMKGYGGWRRVGVEGA